MNKEMGQSGDMLNNTFATRAANLEADKISVAKYDQFKWQHKHLQYFSASIFLLFAAAIYLSVTGHYIWGSLLFLITMLLYYIVGISATMLSEGVYKNGLLMPAIITSTNPLQILVLANMGNGLNTRPVWGCRKINIKALPHHQLVLGEQIPCVAFFNNVVKNNTRMHFEPRPLCWATQNMEVIQNANNYIKNDEDEEMPAGCKNEWDMLKLLQLKMADIKHQKVVFFDDALAVTNPLK